MGGLGKMEIQHMHHKTNKTAQDARFSETHWSLVVAAGGKNARSEQALQQLCQTYWFPLYAFVRREGYSQHDAEDYTQTFLARLIASDDLIAIDRKKGRFRSFLLACMKHFLANEREKSRAQKRGGGEPVLSIDFANAESMYAAEPSHDLSPDKLFDRRWAMTVLDQAMARLKAEMASQGKEDYFEQMKIFLTGGKGDVRYATISAQLEISEAAVKTAVHRMRNRYRKLLGAEIADTVEKKQDVEQELRDLRLALAG